MGCAFRRLKKIAACPSHAQQSAPAATEPRQNAHGDRFILLGHYAALGAFTKVVQGRDVRWRDASRVLCGSAQ